MLTLLLIIPLIGSLIIIPIKEETNLNGGVLRGEVVRSGTTKIKQIGLLTSLLTLAISIVMWLQFDASETNYQFTASFSSPSNLFSTAPLIHVDGIEGWTDAASSSLGLSSPLGIGLTNFHIGVDGISLFFILLTTFITPICILSNWNDIKIKMKYFIIFFLILESLQIGVFVVLDLFLFYILFESVLPILFLIVGIWGASEARIRAAFYLFLYTLAGSLFMLLAILVIFDNLGSTDFVLLSIKEISLENQKILFLAFFLSFAVKTPLWPLMIWLPKAHSEAPLAGSVLLAAIILKFATYGYLRILLQFFPDACAYYTPFIQTIACITIIYASLVTLRQTDTKQMVAYSSVAHMGVVVLGLFSNNITGIEGAILLSLAHGFVSPALFIFVGGVIYSRYHTRTINYLRGLVHIMPVSTAIFFIFILFNTGIPLSLNWLGELLALTGVFQQSPAIAVMGASGIVLSAAYSIWLYTRISYGQYSKHLAGQNKNQSTLLDLNRREFFLLLPLLIVTVVFGIWPNLILDILHVPTSYLIYSN